jgi:hypothetical protein
MERISLTDLVKNEEVFHRAKGERNILRTMKRRKANWFVHILRGKCLLNHISKGKIEGTGRRGRRPKKLLNDRKEARRYWKLKEEPLVDTFWRSGFGRGYRSMQTT